jgi:acyl carrier protein
MEMQEFQMSIPTVSEVPKTDTKTNTDREPPTAAEIQAWIVSYLAQLLEVDPEELNVTIPFDRYGLDSSVAVGLTGDLEDWLETKLDPTLLYDYPTIKALSQHLAEELRLTSV